MGSIFQKIPFNYQYYVGQANLVDYRTDSVTVTGASQLMHTLIAPAKTLVQDGQSLIIRAFGIVTGAANNKSFNVQVNGNDVYITGLTSISNTFGWMLNLIMSRIDNTILDCYGNGDLSISTIGGGGGTAIKRDCFNRLTGLNIDNGLTITFLSTSTTDTITQRYSNMWVI